MKAGQVLARRDERRRAMGEGGDRWTVRRRDAGVKKKGERES